MTEERFGYTWQRVLIDSTRILDPQFDDAVIYVTGAQLELLRNMTQYLNRLSTYVSEYNPGYYLSPTAEDFDAIQAIVADLESVLMGNPNTIWGYNDRWFEEIHYWFSAGGNYSVKTTVVPAGYVYRCQFIGSLNADSLCAQFHVVNADTVPVMIDGWPAVPLNEWQNTFPLDITLKEGDSIACDFYGCTAGDDLFLRVWGDMMVVPEEA